MDDNKIQWHPGFVAAMNLELSENRNDLIFEREYNLNTKPLEVDLLVIKKNTEVLVDNEIGRLFRGHNILEYKSPGDHLNIDTFYKVQSYAGLYKSYGKKVDQIKAEDVTVSLLRNEKPEGLFRYFKEHGYVVTVPYHGIYYVKGSVLFSTQLIVTGELDKKAHIWLGALSEELKKADMKVLLENMMRLSNKADREFADAVFEVSTQANRQVIEELIGDGSMSEALLELMEPIIAPILVQQKNKGLMEGRQEGLREGLQEGIRKYISLCRRVHFPEAEIIKELQKEYSLSEEEAIKYVQEQITSDKK